MNAVADNCCDHKSQHHHHRHNCRLNSTFYHHYSPATWLPWTMLCALTVCVHFTRLLASVQLHSVLSARFTFLMNMDYGNSFDSYQYAHNLFISRTTAFVVIATSLPPSAAAIALLYCFFGRHCQYHLLWRFNQPTERSNGRQCIE